MESRMSPLLSINNLVAAYDERPVIHDLSLDVECGSFIGLIGPNGAGKTTFMLTVSGQFQPQAGALLLPHGRTLYR